MILYINKKMEDDLKEKIDEKICQLNKKKAEKLLELI